MDPPEDEVYSVLGSASGVLQFHHASKGWVRLAHVILQFLDVSKGFALRATQDGKIMLYAAITNLQFRKVDASIHEFILDDEKHYRMVYKQVTDAANFNTLVGNATHENKKTENQDMSSKNQPMARKNAEENGEYVDSLINELKLSIYGGDLTKAAEIATNLASRKVPLSVIQETNAPSVSNNDDFISLRISVEDRYESSAKISVSVKPSITFKTLKDKMFRLYRFPPNVQKWIVGHRITKDHETLKSLNIDTSGCMIYLYLVSAKAAEVTKDNANATQPQSTEIVSITPCDPAASDTVISNPTASQTMSPSNMADVYQFVKHYMEKPAASTNAAPPSVGSQKKTAAEVGWQCKHCTMPNPPRRPSCHMCSNARPDEYVIPPVDSYILDDVEKRLIDEERQNANAIEQVEQENKNQAVLNFERLQQYDQQNLIPNMEAFNCIICFDDIAKGVGVTLRDCLHSFCRDCLREHIVQCEEPEVKCPYNDDFFSCEASLQDREVRALIDDRSYQKFLQRGLATAENQADNSFHCKTINCLGWCIYEDDVNFFQCPICMKTNCLTCKANHEGSNCKEYQDRLKINSINNQAAKETQKMLDELVESGEAMNCPKCKIIVQKKGGCDWIKCTMCKTELCWVTKGPRWGPQGLGDTSGGCQCRIAGKPCHPNCQNCH